MEDYVLGTEHHREERSVKTLRINATADETAAIAIMRLNKAEYPKRNWIHREWKWGRYEFTFQWRNKNSLWGRFGGGWQYELGFQAGGRTIIFNLLVCSLRVSKK